MESRFNSEQERLHKELLIEINDCLDATTAEYAAFKMQITKPLGGAGTLGRCKDIFDIFKQLARRKGQLGILNYDVLKEAFRASNNEDVVDIIDEKERLIREAGDSVGSATGVGSSTTVGGTNTALARQRKAAEHEEVPMGKVPRVNNEDTDPSDGRFFEESGLRYYQTDRKSGYLLILNFEKDRNYTDIDVQNLKQFFGVELRFNVNSPRDEWLDDFTTQQVKERLEHVRMILSDDYESKKYYCFICIILSHGTKGVFKTRDGEYKIDDIRKMYSNQNMPKFAGKPKVFFIQACQGPGEQPPVQLDDEADDEPKGHEPVEIKDQSDTIAQIPNDADVLLAYATTPGYRAFRRKGEGSWFIKECVSVFREFRNRSHLEDMLVTVRERVALNWEKWNQVKQMPCTWSTLTMRLRLRISQL